MQLLEHSHFISLILRIFAHIVRNLIHIDGLLSTKSGLLALFEMTEELSDWSINLQTVALLNTILESTFVESPINIIVHAIPMKEPIIKEACVTCSGQESVMIFNFGFFLVVFIDFLLIYIIKFVAYEHSKATEFVVFEVTEVEVVLI